MDRRSYRRFQPRLEVGMDGWSPRPSEHPAMSYEHDQFRGSLSKTAAALNLHRNAVSYRVRQIFELLEVDPANPDDRLLLQLACRARELP